MQESNENGLVATPRHEVPTQYDISNLLKSSSRHHNLISFGAKEYGLGSISKPLEIVTTLGGIDLDTKLALIHMGYLITDKTSYHQWEKTKGTMRGAMDAVIDRDTVVLHGQDENVQEILSKVRAYKIQKFPRGKAEELSSQHPGAVYQPLRGTNDEVYLITDSSMN